MDFYSSMKVGEGFAEHPNGTASAAQQEESNLNRQYIVHPRCPCLLNGSMLVFRRMEFSTGAGIIVGRTSEFLVIIIRLARRLGIGKISR